MKKQSQKASQALKLPPINNSPKKIQSRYVSSQRQTQRMRGTGMSDFAPAAQNDRLSLHMDKMERKNSTRTQRITKTKANLSHFDHTDRSSNAALPQFGESIYPKVVGGRGGTTIQISKGFSSDKAPSNMDVNIQHRSFRSFETGSVRNFKIKQQRPVGQPLNLRQGRSQVVQAARHDIIQNHERQKLLDKHLQQPSSGNYTNHLPQLHNHMHKTQENKFGKPVISPTKTMRKTYQHMNPGMTKVALNVVPYDFKSQRGSGFGQGNKNPAYLSGNGSGGMSSNGLAKSPQNIQSYEQTSSQNSYSHSSRSFLENGRSKMQRVTGAPYQASSEKINRRITGEQAVIPNSHPEFPSAVQHPASRKNIKPLTTNKQIELNTPIGSSEKNREKVTQEMKKRKELLTRPQNERAQQVNGKEESAIQSGSSELLNFPNNKNKTISLRLASNQAQQEINNPAQMLNFSQKSPEKQQDEARANGSGQKPQNTTNNQQTSPLIENHKFRNGGPQSVINPDLSLHTEKAEKENSPQNDQQNLLGGSCSSVPQNPQVTVHQDSPMPSENHSSSNQGLSGLKEVTVDQMFTGKAVNDHFKGISPTQEEKSKVKKIDPSKIRLLSSRSSKGAKKEIITINSQNIQKSKNERLKSARQIQIKPSSSIVNGQQAAGEDTIYNYQNKMCKENDSGCCFCLPSYISLILLALYDIFIAVASFYNIESFDSGYQIYTYINIALAVWQLIPFIAFLIMRQAVWPRLLIFISHVISLLWMTAYFLLSIAYIVPGNCNHRPGDSCAISDVIQWFLVICLIVNLVFLSFNLFGAFKFVQAARVTDTHNKE